MNYHSKKIDICVRAREARSEFEKCNYQAAHRLFADAFESNIQAWWLAMEAIRSVYAQNVHANSGQNTFGQIIFSPNYTSGNSYQTNLYSEARKFGYSVNSVDDLELDFLPRKYALGKSNIYHQHWIKEYYWNAKTFSEGLNAVQRKVSILKALKMFGVKVAWTLHNLIDHDANELQKELCSYTHREMASVSDIIYVHTSHSLKLLSEQCGTDLTSKGYLLEHPLYDNFILQGHTELPKEIERSKIGQRKVLVHLGMVKPYKGVPELLSAFDNYVRHSQDDCLYLIIGGKVYDPSVGNVLKEMSAKSHERLSLIDRRLSDSEMSALLRLADASVTPYRNILISGSYYLSTTFGKPTVAPRIGMFEDVIKNDRTGILYDGTVTGLTETLVRIGKMGVDKLAEIGAANLELNRHLTIKLVSERYFQSLGFNNA